MGTGFGAVAAAGTTIKFNPPSGSDTVVKNGQTTNVQTRHMCITAMKEYEAKSLEVCSVVLCAYCIVLKLL